MRLRWTKKAVLIIVSYFIAVGLLVYFGDFYFGVRYAFLPNVVIAVITISGGFLLALWLIEGERLRKESEQKHRLISTLRVIKNFLLPWIYHYAVALSGKVELVLDNTPYETRYERELNLLEYIFGIGDSAHERGNYDDTNNEIEEYAYAPQSVRGSLEFGLRNLREIEYCIKTFPSFLDLVSDNNIARLTILSGYIRDRIHELDEWERKYSDAEEGVIALTERSGALRCNLRATGRMAMDALIAIDKRMEELQN